MPCEPKIQRVDAVVRYGLCTGCGVCENACPAGAIQMQLDATAHKPVLDTEQCRFDQGCRRCIDVCAGLGMDLGKWAERLFPQAQADPGLGRYSALYTGHAADEKIRRYGASGGCVSAFLSYLLEQGIIGGAVVTDFQYDDPLRVQAKLVTSAEAVLQARSSKYCPTSLHGIAQDVRQCSGKVAIVGLPCHIHGLRKLAQADSRFATKVFGLFGLFCSSTRSTRLPDYLLWRYGVMREEVTSFAFRGDGNPGFLVIERKHGIAVKVPYHEYYQDIRSCFNNPRCLLCHDHAAELADVAFGDIHVPEFLGDSSGVNSIIVRDTRFDSLLHEAMDTNALAIAPVARDKIHQSQARMIRMKKERIQAVLRMRALFGRSNPNWGAIPFKGLNIKTILGLCANRLQNVFGRHRIFWSIIRPMARMLSRLS